MMGAFEDPVVLLRCDEDETWYEVFLADRADDPAQLVVPAEGKFSDRSAALAYAAVLAGANECGCRWVD